MIASFAREQMRNATSSESLTERGINEIDLFRVHGKDSGSGGLGQFLAYFLHKRFQFSDRG